MNYEEQVIDDVLCWRSSPAAPWVQYTTRELTLKVLQLQAAKEQYEKIASE